ncbi:hypothetical protein Pint_33570 [Pistacia integerrima]|uniref:Uncharacterized protein n=1 Tax=Pistacia integerrima TaxID=434235 RepID=A0ACC0X6Z0_9ROSI|nr:hypothetical protein Pint_33570 [Pistacia integerrima]
MSLTHNLSSSIISSSSSAFLAPTKINYRPQNVSLQAKRIDVCKCVATPQEEKIVELFLIYSGFGEAYKTKVSRNSNIAKLQAGYLFPEVRSDALSFVLLMTLCY